MCSGMRCRFAPRSERLAPIRFDIDHTFVILLRCPAGGTQRMTPATATEQRSEQTTGKTAIRPFRIDIPEEELTDLRRRIQDTRWPERETVPDQTQGCLLYT